MIGEPQPTTLQGMTGWWSVPNGWFIKPIPGTPNVNACANADFSGQVYTCSIADDQINYCFQDLLRDKMNGVLP